MDFAFGGHVCSFDVWSCIYFDLYFVAPYLWAKVQIQKIPVRRCYLDDLCCLFLSHSVEKKLEVCRMEISVLNFMQRSHKSYINLSSRKLARTPLSNTTVRDADFLVGQELIALHTHDFLALFFA